jgi:hypothetical protein
MPVVTFGNTVTFSDNGTVAGNRYRVAYLAKPNLSPFPDGLTVRRGRL